jgi:hypothetical protein
MTVDWTSPAIVDAFSRRDLGLYSPQPDVAAQLERRARTAALTSTSPALPVAVQLVDMFGQQVIPTDRRTGEPTGSAIATVDGLLSHFEDRPVDHVAVATGPRGGWTLVAVEVATTQAWVDWLVGVSGVSWERKVEDGQTRIEKDLRPVGQPGMVAWAGPDRAESWSSGALRGSDLDYHQAGEVLRERQRQRDRGGWVLFSVLADGRGRLPRFSGKRLVTGVKVMATGDLVPVYATRPGGWTLSLTGFPDGTLERACPPWFAAELGARY